MNATLAEEINLRRQCLELAMTQAKMEGRHGDRKTVVEIATLFYNHINPQTETAVPVKATGKKSADKSAPIFE